MIINDFRIRLLSDKRHSRPLISPYHEELLNPSSYDVTLGSHVMVEDSLPGTWLEYPSTTQFRKLDISDRFEGAPYLLHPGQFVLCETQQVFNMPNSLAAQFVLKSSRAREGYQHLMAGYCDPGWNGSKLTMEIRNATQRHVLPLYPGLKIGQMVFMEAVPPERSYAEVGHYNHDEGVSASKTTGERAFQE